MAALQCSVRCAITNLALLVSPGPLCRTGIKAIKLYCYEEPYVERITQLR